MMLVPAEPPHRKVYLYRDDCRQLMKMRRVSFIRWTTGWDLPQKTDFWYVIKDSYKGIDEFSRNTRSKIRRGLKRNTIRKISRGELKEQGFDVYKAAFSNYNTLLDPLSKKEFYERIDTLEDELYDIWGVYRNNQLIAYTEIRKLGKVRNTSITKFHPGYLKDYPSYALFYSLIDHYLGSSEVSYITNGTRSIFHKTNIQDFLIDKFNYRRAYCKLNIFYKPSVKFMIDLLYPFKGLISRIPLGIFQKLAMLLTQEHFRRQCNG
jgi:hypothetical protein